ncbi:hypothetical protein ABK040_008765 [Willaertia magna]
MFYVYDTEKQHVVEQHEQEAIIDGEEEEINNNKEEENLSLSNHTPEEEEEDDQKSSFRTNSYINYTLPSKYIVAVIISHWDNTAGPRPLQVWNGDIINNNDNPNHENHEEDNHNNHITTNLLTDEQLTFITRFSLMDEMPRADEIKDNIEIKFNTLNDMKVMILTCVFCSKYWEKNTFSIFRRKGNNEPTPTLFTISIVMNRDYLSRFMIINKIIREKAITLARILQDCCDKYTCLQYPLVINNFEIHLKDFIKLYDSLCKIVIEQPSFPFYTIFNNKRILKLMKENFNENLFLQKAITSHLETHGYSVVIGSDFKEVNVWVNTLSMFLFQHEKHLVKHAPIRRLNNNNTPNNINETHHHHHHQGSSDSIDSNSSGGSNNNLNNLNNSTNNNNNNDISHSKSSSFNNSFNSNNNSGGSKSSFNNLLKFGSKWKSNKNSNQSNNTTAGPNNSSNTSNSPSMNNHYLNNNHTLDPNNVFIPEIYVQGLLIPPEIRNVKDIVPVNSILSGSYPITIIDLNGRQIYSFKKYHYFQNFKREYFEESKSNSNLNDFGSVTPVVKKEFKDHFDIANRICTSVQELFYVIFEVMPLTIYPSMRYSLISEFMRLLNRKALALAKYVNSINNIESIEHGRIKKILMKHVMINNSSRHRPEDLESELFVILAAAEKLQRGVYSKVTGDPHKEAKDVVQFLGELELI